MKILRQPAKSLIRNRINLDETITSNEDSEEEDYHINNQLNTSVH